MLIAARHLESNEDAPRAGFMVSRIQIWFQKIMSEQTQRCLKPVSVLVSSNRAFVTYE